MKEIKMYSPTNPLTSIEQDCLADFLVKTLGDLGDPKEAVLACLSYAMALPPEKGGLVLIAGEFPDISGALVVNHTGMSEYIPEHILVYFAVDSDKRAKGLGKSMLDLLLQKLPGNLALHVEPGNPAIRLYERIGFTKKYLEMRLYR